MNEIKLESLDLQIELSRILDEENEYLKLVKKKREYKINYLLKEKQEDDEEREYFD